MVFNRQLIAALGVNGFDVLFDFLESTFDFPSCGVKLNHLFSRKHQVCGDERKCEAFVIEKYDLTWPPRDLDMQRSSENSTVRSIAEGLKINKVSLGLGKLRLLDVKEFFEIGIKLLKDDLELLLCNKPECLFCAKYKKTNA